MIEVKIVITSWGMMLVIDWIKAQETSVWLQLRVYMFFKLLICIFKIFIVHCMNVMPQNEIVTRDT